MKTIVVVLLVIGVAASKPFRLMDNKELLQWYLENPSDDTKISERFGQNSLTIRRIPATNSIQKVVELWSPNEKKFKTIKINLKYFKDPTTGWETLQGMTCPLPVKDTAPEVDQCVAGQDVADKLIRVLLSAKIQDAAIEQKVNAANECIKQKVNLPKTELNCFLNALTAENVSKIKKELIAQLNAMGLDVVGGKIVRK